MAASWPPCLAQLSSLLYASRLAGRISSHELTWARATRLLLAPNPPWTLRTISTCKSMEFKRRNLNPEGVPSWANYDGYQKCIDGDGPKKLIWHGYKRNHIGGKPPKMVDQINSWIKVHTIDTYKTRKRCKRGEKVCSNPCPICSRRIEIDYKDADLLSQFICPHSNRVLPAYRTGVCRIQQSILEGAILKARDYGLLPFDIPQVFPEEDQEIRPKAWNRIDIVP